MNTKMSSLSLHRLTPILLMFAVLAFEMSTDIYLPSLPEMAQYFNVPDAAVQTTLSAYLLGFALLGLVAGPLSDSIGRRPIILGSMTVFAAGSIGCWFAPTMIGLIIARFTQGIGAGMTMVVSTAILKDIYDEKNFSRILSTMGMVIALSPMVAPIFGGKIADVWGWKSCFFIIALVASVIWMAIVICLRESLSPEHRATHRTHFSARLLLETYGQLLKRREILTFSLISAITYGGLWAWIVEAPFYMINVLEIKSVDYGYYAAVGPGAYILGTVLNRRCVAFYGIEKMLFYGLWLMIMGAALTLLTTIYWPSSLVALYIPFSIYAIGLAPVFANAVTKAVSVIPSQRGGASALLNTLEMGISAFCAFLVSFLSNGTLVPCASMMLTSGILCAAMFATTAKNTSRKNTFRSETLKNSSEG
ncbi:MAG: multidrug effflux MFS transporter [Candidatus Paracaedibacter sp.]